MLLETNLSQYHGKLIDHFEDVHGGTLATLNMEDAIVLVFTDGTKLKLAPDQRGLECYISQYETE